MPVTKRFSRVQEPVTRNLPNGTPRSSNAVAKFAKGRSSTPNGDATAVLSVFIAPMMLFGVRMSTVATVSPAKVSIMAGNDTFTIVVVIVVVEVLVVVVNVVDVTDVVVVVNVVVVTDVVVAVVVADVVVTDVVAVVVTDVVVTDVFVTAVVAAGEVRVAPVLVVSETVLVVPVRVTGADTVAAVSEFSAPVLVKVDDAFVNVSKIIFCVVSVVVAVVDVSVVDVTVVDVTVVDVAVSVVEVIDDVVVNVVVLVVVRVELVRVELVRVELVWMELVVPMVELVEVWVLVVIALTLPWMKNLGKDNASLSDSTHAKGQSQRPA